MRIIAFGFAALLASAAPAVAQTAPDGTRAFGFQPYVGVLGGVHEINRGTNIGTSPGFGRPTGPLLEGVAGVNIPLGPIFVGAEGTVAKGWRDLNMEYGAHGRFGFRAGDSGLIYATAGYQWIQGRGSRGFLDNDGVMFGIGTEFGPRTIGLRGITNEAGPRIRLEAKTYDFNSIRPMAGVVFSF